MQKLVIYWLVLSCFDLTLVGFGVFHGIHTTRNCYAKLLNALESRLDPNRFNPELVWAWVWTKQQGKRSKRSRLSNRGYYLLFYYLHFFQRHSNDFQVHSPYLIGFYLELILFKYANNADQRPSQTPLYGRKSSNFPIKTHNFSDKRA